MWRRDNCCLPEGTLLVSIFLEYIGMNWIKLLWRHSSRIKPCTNWSYLGLWFVMQPSWHEMIYCNCAVTQCAVIWSWSCESPKKCDSYVDEVSVPKYVGTFLWRLHTAIDKNEVNQFSTKVKRNHRAVEYNLDYFEYPQCFPNNIVIFVGNNTRSFLISQITSWNFGYETCRWRGKLHCNAFFLCTFSTPINNPQ